MSNPKLDEIFRYQQAINDLSEHKLGLLINKRWGQIRVQISYTLESQREHFFELDLNQAYWYVCDMADGLGIGPLGKANRND